MNAEQLRVNAQVEDRHWWFVGRRRIMRAIVESLVCPGSNALVVDVGCGTGGNIGALAKGYRTIGIDSSADAVALAQARFPNTRFVLGHAPRDLGDDARKARLFLLMDVLEHVPDDFLLLSELLEAASPGAYFLITVPADPSLWSKHDESHLHYRRYDLARFRRLWQELPATPLVVSHFNCFLYRPIQMARALNRRRGKSSGEADTDLWLPNRLVNRALTTLYAFERRRILKLLGGRGGQGFRRGVSLLAVLRREPGAITPRGKPADVASDLFHPVLTVA
jgi:SAM-dependent methyltransferase